ncbi:hypothetical protein RRG08_040723 [Elysia crispata]|uniref:Uncharacterized protein n=1 Tax=Elysia crispata TaxID=231223 RepID=A0AAE1BE03_9GAST|nr:hypothetical protein RRG08_040723 [Elysia crispata]
MTQHFVFAENKTERQRRPVLYGARPTMAVPFASSSFSIYLLPNLSHGKILLVFGRGGNRPKVEDRAENESRRGKRGGGWGNEDTRFCSTDRGETVKTPGRPPNSQCGPGPWCVWLTLGYISTSASPSQSEGTRLLRTVQEPQSRGKNSTLDSGPQVIFVVSTGPSTWRRVRPCAHQHNNALLQCMVTYCSKYISKFYEE